MRYRLGPLLVFTCILLSLSVFADDDPHPGHHQMALDKVGTVNFDVTCSSKARQAFPHAVALLHSFAYEEALAEFTTIAAQDQKCAMAYWGQAMTYWRPLWNPPDGKALQNGWIAIQKAASIDVRSGRESGYIQALQAFYSDYDKIAYPTRAMTYRVAMEKLHRYFPKDNEIAAFYALSLLATASPGDKTFRDQHEAGAILERVFTEQPDHPGAAHYIIHSFDNPGLAKDALLAARAYSRIAPSVPHALHMPSHIFTRLGLWNDSIQSNIASEAAAKAWQQQLHISSATDSQLHAMDYLMYAFLQQGRQRDAENVLKELASIQAAQPSQASFYAQSAIPARYAIERGDWKDAMKLQPVPSASPETQAITYWARAMGELHSSELGSAREDINRLEMLRDTVARNKQSYDWSIPIEVQRREAAAWLAHVEKNDDAAVALMRSAADLEDSTEKHPVTPGPVLPAREMLGDLLLEIGHPHQAFIAYEADLKISPHRYRGVQGAARAAAEAGKREAALRYERELQELSGQRLLMVNAEAQRFPIH